ncbi:unnamed protein product [Pylaiella littoralis]
MERGMYQTTAVTVHPLLRHALITGECILTTAMPRYNKVKIKSISKSGARRRDQASRGCDSRRPSNDGDSLGQNNREKATSDLGSHTAPKQDSIIGSKTEETTTPHPCPILLSWTRQHAMTARLLKLKKPLVEYFRRHSTNERKLNSHEWKVTNEVCSLLDVVAEVSIRIQGGADTHLSQTMFDMREIHEIFSEDSHAIRKLDQAYNNGVDVETEEMVEEDLTVEAQKVRRVLLSKLAKKELGTARMPVERICALLDPRRKDCYEDHFINGGEPLKTSAIADVKDVAKTSVDTSNEPAPSATGGSSGAGGSGSNDDGSNPPAPKKPKQSRLMERQLERLAKHKVPPAAALHRRRLPCGGWRSLKRSCGCTWRKTCNPRRPSFLF